MQLKRKRSESELSSSSSAFGSPSRPEQLSMMEMDSIANVSPIRQTSRSSTPSHLHSRTMKRFRNSRPSDEEIHERTLNMLYTAQKQHFSHQQTHPFASLPTHRQPHPAQMPSQGAQASLHDLWKLPHVAPTSNTSVPPPVDRLVYDSPTNCDDCGETLREGAGEDSMDLDGFGSDVDAGCAGCGKHVCSHCSITNLGEQRKCLICAGRKVWVGGLGWTGVSGIKVC
ncbi:uncharacterized protein F4812DRAFT_447540 [Daldinia caldariorum]|uniref:uncharacterized protein n=1 Tax=Daldinia caldariorum TaxID=326644 RepID=UPI002007D175|nr:uncharacterized protein F4812DRAFT_447540 [Daldinia caldariorum]KAI1463224.1 hypothetical protein F4812DRAFT_447540 [Daldinia caldariorum]